ncbi:MAG: NAD(P)/FAD-dependent oxidoreductase [Candidatus Omnitrophica bacterium]|nr:NAD(P)/FAD-dependent oxidoreductase [Candidatus Omnitrophota bacterium]
MKTIIIIGAGPAGLGAGYELTKNLKNDYQIIIFEKENQVGGIAKTIEYNGYRFDLGGHRFFSKNDEIMNLWKNVLKEKFIKVKRLSRIYYKGKFYFYPIKPFNALLNLGLQESISIMLSWMKTKIKPKYPEISFEDWISNRFGKRLYEIFFKTYTEKVWGIPCRKISSDWAAQRIKGLSLLSLLKSSIFRQKKQKIKTLIEEFYYPELGPGMMWETFAKIIEENHGKVEINSSVEKIFLEGKRIKAIEVKNLITNSYKVIECEHLISSMPLREFIEKLVPSPNKQIIESAKSLNYRSFIVVGLIVNKKDIFPDNWIYIHSPEVLVGRIQNFKNWSKKMVQDINKTCLGLEYFCSEGDKFWLKPSAEVINIAKKELEILGFAKINEIEDGKVIKVEKAYPVYDENYKENVNKIREYLNSISNLQVIGRNGMHKYNNQDHSMITGILAARNILGESYDLWRVNVDAEYLEEIK